MTDLSLLPHEHFCDLASPHVDCCPGRTRECTCLTAEVAKAFEAQLAELTLTGELALCAARVWREKALKREGSHG